MEAKSCLLKASALCVHVYDRQWLLTAGAQDFLWSWRHGLDTVLAQAVLSVKGHPVPGRERSSGSGWHQQLVNEM